jgi:hypothetical protein
MMPSCPRFVAGIQVLADAHKVKDVAGRDKPGRDENWSQRR